MRGFRESWVEQAGTRKTEVRAAVGKEMMLGGSQGGVEWNGGVKSLGGGDR